MKKTWLIFLNEYKRHVLRKRFLVGILSMPLLIGVIALVGFLSVWLQYNKAPVGYIDAGNLIANPNQVPVEKNKLIKTVASIRYQSEADAKSALNDGSIQAYFILSDNYLASGEATMVRNAQTGSNANVDFADFMKFNLLQGQSPEVVNRLTEGDTLIIRSLDGSREMSEDNWVTVMLPIVSGLLFMITVNISGGYLLQAVVEEKENRTVEIVVTSVSPGQLMAGKILGDLMVGLTQLIVWIAFVLLALKIAPFFISNMINPKIEPAYILLMAATLLPAFVMIAAAMGAVGATAVETREAQQIAGWFTIPIVIPFWFISAIMFNPNGGLSVGMSLFPLTAPIALPLRAMFTNVPGWQIAISISLLCLAAAFSLWLAGRVFRLGMLRYGKRVSFREVFRRIGVTS